MTRFTRDLWIVLGFLVILADTAQIACGQDKGLKVSWSTLVGATAVDAASSWGKPELNPILGRGTFGGRQVAIAGGITGGMIGVQALVVRKWPKAGRVLRWVNFGVAGVHLGVAAHNQGIPSLGEEKGYACAR